jgi:hypothetical protein
MPVLVWHTRFGRPAGLLLAATLAERLRIEQTTDQLGDLGHRIGATPLGASCSS